MHSSVATADYVGRAARVWTGDEPALNIGGMGYLSGTIWWFVQASPCRTASATASARLATPSLAKTLVRWVPTVRGLTNNASAISGLVLPSTRRRRISDSRGVRPKGSAVAATLVL